MEVAVATVYEESIAGRVNADLCAPSRRDGLIGFVVSRSRGMGEVVANAARGAVFLAIRVAERSASTMVPRGGAASACARVGCGVG